MVQLEGFEPPTFRFVAERSIQLSYSCDITTTIILGFQKIFNRKCKKNLQIIKKYAIIYKQFKLHTIHRGVAQLVARVVWDHEVAGSIPVTSTNESVETKKFQHFLFSEKLYRLL